MPMQTIVTDVIFGDQPYRLGMAEAKGGLPCLPSAYYSAPDAIVHYVMGYAAVAGASPTTDMLLAAWDGPEIPKAFTTLHWQMRCVTNAPGGEDESRWRYVMDEDVLHRLRDCRMEPVQEMEYMSLKPGRVITTALYQFRFVQKEPVV